MNKNFESDWKSLFLNPFFLLRCPKIRTRSENELEKSQIQHFGKHEGGVDFGLCIIYILTFFN